MDPIYTEENGRFRLDCTNAIWSTNKVHQDYQNSNHTYGKIGFLCDADFIIESDRYIIIVEYKNANIPGAAHPERFNPTGSDSLDKVARKFYDTFHWLYLAGKDKPKKYIYVLEYPTDNTTSRLLVRNKLKDRLPFALQQKLANSERKLIDEVRVMSISEWNSDSELMHYPIRPVENAAT